MALSRLADALRLGHAERAYLFELADRRDPVKEDESADAVQPAVIASLKTIDAPAYLLDGGWNAVGWNEGAERLFVGWLDKPGERNLLRYIFLEPAARALIHDYDGRARRVVAEFRANVGAHLEDAPMRALMEELRTSSPLFAQLWGEQSVQSREGGMRTFNHPQDGFRRYEQVTFNVASRPQLKLTILLPPEAA
jgi:hypothetical protein